MYLDDYYAMPKMTIDWEKKAKNYDYNPTKRSREAIQKLQKKGGMRTAVDLQPEEVLMVKQMVAEEYAPSMRAVLVKALRKEFDLLHPSDKTSEPSPS